MKDECFWRVFLFILSYLDPWSDPIFSCALSILGGKRKTFFRIPVFIIADIKGVFGMQTRLIITSSTAGSPPLPPAQPKSSVMSILYWIIKKNITMCIKLFAPPRPPAPLKKETGLEDKS